MKRYLFALVCVVISINVFAQSDQNLLTNDPDFAQFTAQIGIGLETNFSHRTEVPISIGFHYDFENAPIELDASFLLSVFGDRKSSFYPDNLSDNPFQNFNSFDAGATYNFIDNTTVKYIKVIVGRKSKSKSWGEEVTVYTTERKGLVRQRFGVRAGLYRYAQSITDYDAIDRSIKFPDGTTFPHADNAWSGQLTDNEKFFFTAERHLAAYLGLSYHRSHSIAIDAGQSGERRSAFSTFIYADLFLDLASDIQKLGYQGKLYDLTTATSGVDLNTLGCRLGVKRVGGLLFYGFEAGLKPQYLKTQFYGQFMVGYSFNRNF